MTTIESSYNKAAVEAAKDSRRIVRKHQEEVQRINDTYNQLKRDMKTEGEIKLTEQQIQNEKRISEDTRRKAEVLQKMGQLTKDSTKMLESEKERIKKSIEENIDNTRIKSEVTIGNIQHKNQQILQDETNRYNKEIQEIHNEANSMKMKKYDEQLAKVRDQDQINHEKLQNQNDSFENRFSSSEKMNQTQLNNQKHSFAKEYEDKKRIHDTQISKLKFLHETELNGLEKSNKQATQGVRLNFENKYSKIKESHIEQMANLKKVIDQDLNKTLNKYSVEKSSLENKAEDSFYRMNHLSPTVTEKLDRYIIKIKVPEHEKDQISISGRGKRKIRISMDRNYQEEFTDPSGMANKSKKYETYSKELGFDQIIDFKKISKSYSDGQLIFDLKKA